MGVVHSGLWVATMAALLCLGSFVSLGLEPQAHVLVLAFLATLLIYGLDRLGSPEDQANVPARARWVQEHRGLLRLQIFFAGAGALLLLPQLRRSSLTVGAACAFLALAYVLPGPAKPLKRVAALKALTVALVWGLASVVVPAMEGGAWRSWELAWLTLHHGLAVGAAAVLFDLKDLLGDQRAGLQSPAVVLGFLGARALARLCASVAVGLALWGWWSLDFSAIPLSLSGSVFLLTLAPAKTDDGGYYGILVDGALGLPGLLVLLRWGLERWS